MIAKEEAEKPEHWENEYDRYAAYGGTFYLPYPDDPSASLLVTTYHGGEKAWVLSHLCGDPDSSAEFFEVSHMVYWDDHDLDPTADNPLINADEGYMTDQLSEPAKKKLEETHTRIVEDEELVRSIRRIK